MPKKPPAFQSPTPFQQNPNGLWIDPMFLRQDSSAKRRHIIVVPYGHRLLKDDGATVQFGRDEVNRDPGLFHAVLPRLVLCIHSRERRQ